MTEIAQGPRSLREGIISLAAVQAAEYLIPLLALPDPNDRHVLAAAIVGRCDVIVTQNLKHFPEAALTPYGIRAEHPDEFLCHHLDSVSGLFCGAVNKVRARLKNPPYTVEEVSGES